ncbi:hypothetical protein QBC43DRAFT_336836 [Cladorrhinum sp. PSN259]|nr:hypothetical protein QBC43DRAFT_336836 [Cladorrhinum sp. PSN259]
MQRPLLSSLQQHSLCPAAHDFFRLAAAALAANQAASLVLFAPNTEGSESSNPLRQFQVIKALAKMVTKEEYEKEKQESEKVRKEYEKKKAEHEKKLGEWEKARGEQGRGGHRLDEGSVKSRIPRLVYVPSGSCSGLEDGLFSSLIREEPLVTGHGGLGGHLDEETSLSRGLDTFRQQKGEARGDNLLGKGVGRSLPPSRIPVTASRLRRKEHFPAIPTASMVRPQRRAQSRLEVSRAGSPSRPSNLLSRDCLALGLSSDESIRPPILPRSVQFIPARSALATPDCPLPSSRLRLPGSAPTTAPPATPTRDRRGRVFVGPWEGRHNSSSSHPSHLPPLPPPPPSLFAASASVAPITTTTTKNADGTTTPTTTTTMRPLFGAGPSGPIIGKPEVPKETTPPLVVTEGESFWITTPSPSPNKAQNVAAMAARSFGRTIRGKLSFANLRDSSGAARVVSNDSSGSGSVTGGLRGFLSRSSQGTTFANRSSGPSAPVASRDVVSGSAVVPAPDPFSSSPPSAAVAAGGGRVVSFSSPSSIELPLRSRRLRPSVVAPRAPRASGVTDSGEQSSSPPAFLAGITTTASTSSAPLRPLRPSAADIAAAFACVEPSTTADQDVLSSAPAPREDPFFSAPTPASTNLAAGLGPRTATAATTTPVPAAFFSAPVVSLAGPSGVRPPLPPPPTSPLLLSPERPALRKKRSLADFFFRKKEKKGKGKGKEKELVEEKKEDSKDENEDVGPSGVYFIPALRTGRPTGTDFIPGLRIGRLAGIYYMGGRRIRRY